MTLQEVTVKRMTTRRDDRMENDITEGLTV